MLNIFQKRVRQSQGFTLIELLIAALISGIFLAATAGIVVQVMRIDRQESARMEVQAELTQALDFIQKDISEALFIYSDLTDATGDPSVGPDGIPDMNQLLFTPGFIKRPPNSLPVVAFWKYVPIPSGCLDTDGSLLDSRPGAPSPDDGSDSSTDIDPEIWNDLRVRRQVLVLVAYYLRRNYSGTGNPIDAAPWEGNARITRYELTPFALADCNVSDPTYSNPPDPFDNSFLDWPDPVPTERAQGGSSGIPNVDRDPITVISNIYSSRPGRVRPAPACPAGYSLGGYKAADVDWPNSQLPDGEADAAFYVCVRQDELVQDVIINLTGISLQRANPGLFRRYIEDEIVVSEEELAGYLHTFRDSRVLSDGVLGG